MLSVNCTFQLCPNAKKNRSYGATALFKKKQIVLKSYYTLHFRKSAVNLHIEKLASYS